jgi:CheY-like chemotaxis protein
MSLLAIRLFGGFMAVDHRGNALSIGNRRTRALLAWLAMSIESDCSVRDFAELFGESGAISTEALEHDLQFALRFCLPDLLERDKGSLRLNANLVDVDTVRFDHLAARDSITAIREAAELYRGPIFGTLDDSGVEEFDRWLSSERQRFAASAVAVFGKLLAAQIKAGWWEAAVDTAGRLLALDPTQEVVHRTLMRLQLEQGRPDSALRRYHECFDILRREFSRFPSPETERVHQEILDALKRTPAPRDVFLKPLDRPVLVLLVEDDLVSAALMEGYLSDAGYAVVTVGDGAEALIEIGRHAFDLLVLDINVPTLNGLQFFEIMMQKGFDTPAIFITGSAGPEVEARSLELGAADFLRKPIRRETLLPRIRSIVQRRERAPKKAHGE